VSIEDRNLAVGTRLIANYKKARYVCTVEAAEGGDINRRLCATFLSGAELQSRRQRGRGLTEDDLRRVIHRYPGDVREP